MTCVVGLVDRGQVFMGADSAGSTLHGQITTRTDKKIFMNGELMVGICGSFRMRDILQYHITFKAYDPKIYTPLEYVNHEVAEKAREAFKTRGLTVVENNEETFNGSFIVGFRKKLFEVECDFQVGEAETQYLTCGSGGDIAAGSLFSTQKLAIPPVDRIQIALNAAAYGNAFVRGPFYINSLEVKPPKSKRKKK